MREISGEVMACAAPRSQAAPDDSREDHADSSYEADDSPGHTADDGDKAKVIRQLCDATTVGEAGNGGGVPRCPAHDRDQGGSGVPPTVEAHEAPEEA